MSHRKVFEQESVAEVLSFVLDHLSASKFLRPVYFFLIILFWIKHSWLRLIKDGFLCKLVFLVSLASVFWLRRLKSWNESDKDFVITIVLILNQSEVTIV